MRKTNSKILVLFDLCVDMCNVSLTANSALLVFMKLTLDKAQHQAGLSNSRLTKQNKLELAYLALGCPIGPLGLIP